MSLFYGTLVTPAPVDRAYPHAGPHRIAHTSHMHVYVMVGGERSLSHANTFQEAMAAISQNV